MSTQDIAMKLMQARTKLSQVCLILNGVSQNKDIQDILKELYRIRIKLADMAENRQGK